MNVCGFDWQARYRLSNHANSVGFPPDCTHSDLILLPLVKNAVMTMVSTPLPCTAVRDGGSRPRPPGMPSRSLLGDPFPFLPHGVTGHEIFPLA